ncbi:alpha/beta hydrolase [Diplocloster agilis]|uniref:alpha/beta hydrolase n=1 Tax=Diplocloster agilis TaxID=2850323 RepID=UPI0008224D93|nr:alpha/beta hydrolase [Suonthocola fibrivorans]MCU6736005.1 alpha/beta hydrolase [Suonthocola fibrivorans]SCJ85094.1 Monoterpene epsilon-lactone hydrolase [uncultured Clostridium sp.]
MEKATKRNQNLMRAIKRMHTLVESDDIEKQRASQENLSGLFTKSKEMKYESFEIDHIPAEWVSVDRRHIKKYVILYCHGGGYNTGSFRYARSITNKLASTTSMDVLSFDYRLAPESPFPYALQDAIKAWDYLMHFGYGARDVIVAGDSAGGNLALTLVLKLKEQGRILPRGLILFSPWTDLTKSGKSHQSKAEIDPILSEEYLDKAILDYAADQELTNPFISPLFADFEGFPPTYIQVGNNEILLSDSVNLQRQMQKCHVQVRLDLYKGMWHVFQMAPFKAAYDAIDQMTEFIFDICR